MNINNRLGKSIKMPMIFFLAPWYIWQVVTNKYTLHLPMHLFVQKYMALKQRQWENNQQENRFIWCVVINVNVLIFFNRTYCTFMAVDSKHFFFLGSKCIFCRFFFQIITQALWSQAKYKITNKYFFNR